MNLQEACEKINVNYKDTLERFCGNEVIYKKFLKRFLEDGTYSNLEQAWEERDYEEIEKNAHTLKGLAGNLGLESLFNNSNNLFQTIKKKEYKDIERIISENRKRI